MTKGDKNPNVLFLLCTVSVFPALWLHISSQRERDKERKRGKKALDWIQKAELNCLATTLKKVEETISTQKLLVNFPKRNSK